MKPNNLERTKMFHRKTSEIEFGDQTSEPKANRLEGQNCTDDDGTENKHTYNPCIFKLVQASIATLAVSNWAEKVDDRPQDSRLTCQLSLLPLTRAGWTRDRRHICEGLPSKQWIDLLEASRHSGEGFW